MSQTELELAKMIRELTASLAGCYEILGQTQQVLADYLKEPQAAALKAVSAKTLSIGQKLLSDLPPFPR